MYNQQEKLTHLLPSFLSSASSLSTSPTPSNDHAMSPDLTPEPSPSPAPAIDEHDPSQTRLTDMFKVVRKGSASRSKTKTKPKPKRQQQKKKSLLPPPADAEDPPPSPQAYSQNDEKIGNAMTSGDPPQPMPVPEVSVLLSPAKGRCLDVSLSGEKVEGEKVVPKMKDWKGPRMKRGFVCELDDSGRARVEVGEREERVVWTYEGGVAVGEEDGFPSVPSSSAAGNGNEEDMRRKREEERRRGVQRWLKAFEEKREGEHADVKVVKAELSSMGRCIVSRDYLLAMGWPIDEPDPHPSQVPVKPLGGGELYEWEYEGIGGKKGWKDDIASRERKRRIEDWLMDESSSADEKFPPPLTLQPTASFANDGMSVVEDDNPYIESKDEVAIGGRGLVTLLRVKKQKMDARKAEEETKSPRKRRRGLKNRSQVQGSRQQRQMVR
ncbi:hypothetical protein BT69DRAFT_288466 [Atractiella rhizophila]|nr:hypothetical protein BT69DRAFT_288466 [Atractiella rhizophila]